MRPPVDNKGQSSVSPPAGYIGTKYFKDCICEKEHTPFSESNMYSMNSFRKHHQMIKSINECEEVNPVLRFIMRGSDFKLSASFKGPNIELFTTSKYVCAEFNLRPNESKLSMLD